MKTKMYSFIRTTPVVPQVDPSVSIYPTMATFYEKVQKEWGGIALESPLLDNTSYFFLPDKTCIVGIDNLFDLHKGNGQSPYTFYQPNSRIFQILAGANPQILGQ